MDKVRKWEASHEQASDMVTPAKKLEQALMCLRKSLGTDLKEKVFALTVIKMVTLFKARVVQLEVGSTVSVGNMVIMLAVAKGEEIRSLESKAPLNNREVANRSW